MSRPDRKEPNAGGFSLLELIVTLAIMLIALASMGSLFLGASHQRRDSEVRLELNHGLRVGLDAVLRDVRLAGSCIGTGGEFPPFAATNSGLTDTITINYGRLHPDTNVCLGTALDQPASNGDNAIFITPADADGFESGMRLFLVNGAGFSEFVEATSDANATTGRITLGSALTYDYAAGRSAFAVSQRSYSIQTAALGRPYLALQLDGGSATPLADGIDQLNVRYVLDDGSGTIVDVPTTAQLSLVNEVLIDSRIRLPVPGTNGAEHYTTSASMSGKPRNLLR